MGENRYQNQGEHTVCRTTSTNIVNRVEFNLSLSFLAAKIKKRKRDIISYIFLIRKRKTCLKESKDFIRVVLLEPLDKGQ